jgi:hypothetical protein
MSLALIKGIDPYELQITQDGYAKVETRDKFDIDDLANSTNANLAANLQFSGNWKDCTAFRSIVIFALSNVSSANGGLKLQFSNDGSAVDFSWDISTNGNIPKYYKMPIYGKFFRVIYVNSATAQASFRINVRQSFSIADITTMVSDFASIATGTVGAAVSCNLPPAGIGTYHYITSIRIEKFATALMTAGTAPISATSSNLNGFAPNSGASALAQGINDVVLQEDFSIPLKSQNANAQTSIAMPATPLAIYKISVTYFVGA